MKENNNIIKKVAQRTQHSPVVLLHVWRATVSLKWLWL